MAIEEEYAGSGSEHPIITVYGTKGKFSVNNFLRMEFLETTFSLSDQMLFGENRLVEILRPAREMFQEDQFDMDSVLQRAINDERVSNEIIPYLRGEDTSEFGQDIVTKSIRPRFFPNIIAAVVPVEGEELAPNYPQFEQTDKRFLDPEFGGVFHKRSTFGSGDKFCFSVASSCTLKKVGDELEIQWDRVKPCPVRLQLSKNNCRLVIIDGQHRAMALLALARNAANAGGPSWDSKSKAFEPFYDGKKFSMSELSGIHIPLTVVWFPEIVESGNLVDNHGADISTACRALFSDINSNAIEMDKTSTILLSGEDVSHSFTRYLMNKILGVE